MMHIEKFSRLTSEELAVTFLNVVVVLDSISLGDK